MCSGSIHTAQWFQRLVRTEARCVGDHHLGQADDGVERRAQLVAHAGQELRLILARHFELAALVLEFSGTSTQFGQQPCILDSNDGLAREVLDQVDLPVGERPHFLAINGDRADELVLLEHRHVDHRSSAGQVGEAHQRRLTLEVSLLRPDIGHMYRLLRCKQAPKWTVRARADHRFASR